MDVCLYIRYFPLSPLTLGLPRLRRDSNSYSAPSVSNGDSNESLSSRTPIPSNVSPVGTHRHHSTSHRYPYLSPSVPIEPPNYPFNPFPGELTASDLLLVLVLAS